MSAFMSSSSMSEQQQQQQHLVSLSSSNSHHNLHSVIKTSPYSQEYFVVGGGTSSSSAPNDNSLFRLYRHNNKSANNTNKFSLVKSFQEKTTSHSKFKCLDWYCHNSNSTTSNSTTSNSIMNFAIGTTDGKLIITDLQNNTDKEFNPKYSRPANAVAWNPHNINQVAVAYDKVRSDYCTLVWDINQDQPAFEFSNSEAAVALAWAPCLQSVLVTGTNFKWMRLYDLRIAAATASNAPVTSVVAHDRAVKEIVFSHSRPELFATVGSGGGGSDIKIWDVRKVSSTSAATPVYTLQSPVTGVSNVMFDTNDSTRLIATTSSSNDSAICVWDTNSKKPVCKRYVADNNGMLSSVAFKSSDRVLLLLHDGTVKNVLLDVRRHRAPVAVSPTGVSATVEQAQQQKIITLARSSNNDDDISSVMKSRATTFYYSTNAMQNLKHLVLDSNLIAAWRYVATVEECQDIFFSYVKGSSTKTGRLVASCWPNTPGTFSLASVLLTTTSSSQRRTSTGLGCSTYHSAPRTLGLLMCHGWQQASSQKVLNTERAAALAVWKGELRTAVDILLSSDFKLVAMAVAGFDKKQRNSDDGNDDDGLWQKMCTDLLVELNDYSPYLYSLVSFLLTRKNVKLHPDISLCDKLGFACTFYDDKSLKNFIATETKSACETGDLQGVVLTGLEGQDFSDLAQCYVDRTSDVQSVALLVSRVAVITTSSFCEVYRDLLNAWQLWHIRATFDIAMAESAALYEKRQDDLVNSNSTSSSPTPSRLAALSIYPPPPPQITIRCNFCQASLSSSSMKNSSSSSIGGGNISNSASPVSTSGAGGSATNATWLSRAKPVLNCCPSCRKPLPSCALCLLPLGTINPINDLRNKGVSSSSNNCIATDEWITYCVSCNHGGHCAHIEDWFKAGNIECPVTDCECKCGEYF